MNADTQILMQKKSEGQMSANQAYKEYLNAGGSGSFKEWMNNAVDKGWVDQAFNAASSILHSKFGIGASGSPLIIDTPCDEGFEKDVNGICQPIKTGLSTGAWIGIGVVAIGIIGFVIYEVKKGKN
jgi:hypothetical protein